MFLESRKDRQRRSRCTPVTSSSEKNVIRVEELLQTDHRMSVHLVAIIFNILETIVHKIVIKDLCIKNCMRTLSREF